MTGQTGRRENSGDVNAFLAAVPADCRELANAVHAVVIERGLAAYVKTIYIGYQLGDDMVAALYAPGEQVEVALALAEDAEHRLLIDASHLTWRTMPVAAVVNTQDDLPELEALIDEACERVRTHTHGVERDNDFFMNARRRRRGLT